MRERTLAERPRERLLLFGEDDLCDSECLALVVGNVAHRSALAVGRELLERFGDLRAIHKADGFELVREGRLGVAGAAALKAAFVLGRRALRVPPDPASRVRSGADLYEQFRARFANARKENFMVVCLDGRNRVMREERVSEGTLNAAIVHPRDVFGPALRVGAASIVVLHNHPSGDPAPSAEDIAVTARLREAGALVGIPLLDHIILGDERYYSFLERGALVHGGAPPTLGSSRAGQVDSGQV